MWFQEVRGKEGEGLNGIAELEYQKRLKNCLALSDRDNIWRVMIVSQ